MLEAQIPKDIRKYEAKLAGPFTLRQLVCFILACLLAYISYKGITSFAPADTAVPVCMLVVSPILAFGWIKPYGMTLEKFLQTALVGSLLAPKVRKYKTRNNFRGVGTKLQKMTIKEYKKRVKKDRKLAQQNNAYEAFR